MLLRYRHEMQGANVSNSRGAKGSSGGPNCFFVVFGGTAGGLGL